MLRGLTVAIAMTDRSGFRTTDGSATHARPSTARDTVSGGYLLRGTDSAPGPAHENGRAVTC
jgi:hypothetical protein